jgi:hypothetical protein
MKNKNKHHETLLNAVFYGFTSLLAVVFIVNIVGGIFDGGVFQGSVLSIFNKIGLTDFDEAKPDLGIEYVYLRKDANPTADFDYYRYNATVVVRNYGEKLENGTVVITAGQDQKNAFVSNGIDGLTLKKGETFIFEDYEVLMGGRFNYGSYQFNLVLKDQDDGDDDNNLLLADVYEEPVKMESFALENMDERDGFTLSYVASSDYLEELGEMDTEVCIAFGEDVVSEKLMKYTEVDLGDDVFSHYRIKASRDLLLDELFECESFESFDGLSEDWSHDEAYTVFLRSYDRESNGEEFFANSNILHLPVQRYLNRAEFTKIFMDESGIGVNAEGKAYFNDVDQEQWYAPYIQTMFNYGLLKDPIDFTFMPDEDMPRSEILEPLLNHFDVDLVMEEGAPHFHDIPKGHEAFDFAEFLYSSGKAKTLGIYFNPEKRVSSDFIKYLVNEFKES